VSAPHAVVAEAGAFGAGDGFAVDPALAARLRLARHDATLRPTARAVGELAAPRVRRGATVAARDAEPLYVRHRVALTADERAAGARL
jgi:tRNA threonylcarbamoyladenosine biosynthesis protein TsaB